MPGHRLVIVGGGFAGLACAESLKDSGAKITLIDRRNHHLFQPLLYQAATSTLPLSDIAWPLRQVFRTRRDVTTLLGEVAGVDAVARCVRLTDGATIAYDTLVLATGAQHAYFGNDEWAAHAHGLKTLEDATRIRAHILTAFEAAERAEDPAERQRLMTFVVVGGGPTGVEMAAAIAELARRVMQTEFRNVDTRDARVISLEAGPRILGAFPESLGRYAKRALERQGVEVRLGSAVTDCGPGHVTARGRMIRAKTAIWAAGVQASDAARWIGAASDRVGRVQLAADLTVPGCSEIFVIGDTATVTSVSGAPVPGTAPAAKQMGRHAALVIASRLQGGSAPAPFRYRHQGNFATIGRRAAIVDLGWIHLSGPLASWTWGICHIWFLIGTRSRIVVALNWLWSHLFGHKCARCWFPRGTEPGGGADKNLDCFKKSDRGSFDIRLG
ncbi:NAD(P)/FAD-dependent oxidoreductase [Peteryoungia desertarenae]